MERTVDGFRVNGLHDTILQVLRAADGPLRVSEINRARLALQGRADAEGGTGACIAALNHLVTNGYAMQGANAHGAHVWSIIKSPAPTVDKFTAWWEGYWKNNTDTIQHTIAKGIARDAWEAGRKS